MIVTSKVTGIRYDPEETVKIYNTKQIGKYIKHGAIIVDVETDEEDKVYMRFFKKDHAPLFLKWRNYDLT